MTSDIRSRARRLARLLEEQAEIAAQIAEVKAEAKADGYDPALLVKTARLLVMDEEKRRKQLDQHELFDTYLSAVGLVAERAAPETPPLSGFVLGRVSDGGEPEPHVHQEAHLSRSAHSGTDRNQGDAASSATEPTGRQTVGASLGGAYPRDMTAEAPQAATPIRRDEEPEMPAFLRRTRPVASEITA